MPQHEIEISISPEGWVKVHIQGAKGKACLEYAEWLTQLLGRAEDQQLTSEYYEPETKNRHELRQELRGGEG